MVALDSFLIFLEILSAVILYLVLGRLSHFPNRGILDVPEFLRPANPRRMQELLNSEFEMGLRAALPRREFLRQQRKSLHYVLEFLLCMVHDAYILIEFADNEVFRETVSLPAPDDSYEFAAKAAHLQRAAIEFRIYALVAISKVRFWIIFRTQWWLPFSPPQVADLREVSGIPFHTSFQRLIQAVSELGLLYGAEFQEALLNAIFRADPLRGIE